jgi:pyrroloquinoline-quinone synthase
MKADTEVIPSQRLWPRIDAVLAKYDLLLHPFYRAWAAGELSHAQLAAYGAQYLPHVAAFPAYLTALHSRLPEGPSRKAVLANAADEEVHGRSHADIWRDFTREMQAGSELSAEPVAEVQDLIDEYTSIARTAPPATALGALYAYESQVPRVAQSKLDGLKTRYAASEKACRYFALHITADVHHSNVWRRLMDDSVAADPACAEEILRGVNAGAKALWLALDGIEAARIRSLPN